jgi:hypothetical protein
MTLKSMNDRRHGGPKLSKRPVVDLDARHMLAMSKVCGLTVAVIGFALTVIWKL